MHVITAGKGSRDSSPSRYHVLKSSHIFNAKLSGMLCNITDSVSYSLSAGGYNPVTPPTDPSFVDALIRITRDIRCRRPSS